MDTHLTVPTLGPYLRVVINECSFHIKRGKAGSLHQKLLIKHSNTEGTSINDVTPKGGRSGIYFCDTRYKSEIKKNNFIVGGGVRLIFYVKYW